MLSKKVILMALLLCPFLATAAMDENVTVRGVLKKYDKEYIWLETGKETKGTVKIPRRAFPDLNNGYVAGVAKISAEVSIAEVYQLNPEVFGK